MKKLTDWHPPHVKPVHVGVYETNTESDAPGFEWYQYWNGRFWCETGGNPYRALKLKNKKSHPEYLKVRWRGYTTKQD